MSDEDCYRRLNPCKAAKEVARLATTAFGDQVGERSALGRLKTRLSIDVLARSVDITRLQVPPRPPKRQSKDCLFFCQSMVVKTVKTPDFLRKNRKTGFFMSLESFSSVRNYFCLFSQSRSAAGRRSENHSQQNPPMQGSNRCIGGVILLPDLFGPAHSSHLFVYFQKLFPGGYAQFAVKIPVVIF